MQREKLPAVVSGAVQPVGFGQALGHEFTASGRLPPKQIDRLAAKRLVAVGGEELPEHRAEFRSCDLLVGNGGEEPPGGAVGGERPSAGRSGESLTGTSPSERRSGENLSNKARGPASGADASAALRYSLDAVLVM